MKHTEETKKKISETMKRRRATDLPPWNIGIQSHRKGKTYEDEYGTEMAVEIKTKISNNRKGKWMGHTVSKETRKKISKSNIGRIVSFETRLKISNSQTGMKKPWAKGMIGHEVSEETRIKISIYHSGDEIFNGFKQGFKTRLRNVKQYHNWRYSVFKRDNFTCIQCGYRGYLEAHHIVSLSSLIKKFKITSLESAIECKELWDITNGVSYCQKCHIKNDYQRAKFGSMKK